jgi:hypothetical protein
MVMTKRCSQRAFPATNRRQFLVAGTATLAVSGFGLTGCSGNDDTAPPQLQSLFFPSFVLAAGIEQRIPFGLIDQGIPLNEDTTTFRAKIRRGEQIVFDGEVPARIVTHDHPEGNETQPHEHADLLRYFAVRATFEDPGIYDLELSFDDKAASLPFQIFDQEDVVVPLPGETLPELRFPTFGNEMDMDPICTQFAGPCPLHDKTIEEALETGRPLALLIATPAFCETAYCGPVLDVMLELRPDFPNIEFLHAEVYQNPNEADGNFLDERVLRSPTVVDLDLPFEPTLFLLRPDRTIMDRIDNVYDNTELREALQKL